MPDPTELFEKERPRLLGLAYRMLGMRSEAEDVVQEVWLRWHRSEGVEDPARWLFTVTSRVALDQLKSARRRREHYVGPWLPEPVAGALDVEPASVASDPAELADSLSMALLHVLERLTPSERAAFLLRQVFDYDYAEIAEVVGKSEPACRQLVSRAKKRLAQEKLEPPGTERSAPKRAERFRLARRRQEELMQRFAAAANEGDLTPLEDWLDRDVVLYTDGGGKVHAALKPIYGADKVTRFFLGVWPKRPPGTRLVPRMLNGEPALLALADGQPVQTMHFRLDLHRAQSGEAGAAGLTFTLGTPEASPRWCGRGQAPPLRPKRRSVAIEVAYGGEILTRRATNRSCTPVRATGPWVWALVHTAVSVPSAGIPASRGDAAMVARDFSPCGIARLLRSSAILFD